VAIDGRERSESRRVVVGLRQRGYTAVMSDRVFFALSAGIATGLIALALVWP